MGKNEAARRSRTGAVAAASAGGLAWEPGARRLASDPTYCASRPGIMCRGTGKGKRCWPDKECAPGGALTLNAKRGGPGAQEARDKRREAARVKVAKAKRAEAASRNMRKKGARAVASAKKARVDKAPAERARAEAARLEATRAEAARLEATRAEAARAEAADAARAVAEEARCEAARVEAARAGARIEAARFPRARIDAILQRCDPCKLAGVGVESKRRRFFDAR